MADVATNGKKQEEDDWEYEDEEADDYEWEYSEEEEEEEANEKKSKVDEEEEEIPLDEQDLPDPFSAAPAVVPKTTTAPKTTNGSGRFGEEESTEEKRSHRKHHKKHKKSKHSDRVEQFEKTLRGDEEKGHRSKKIHVRSKDPMRIAKQFEKGSSKEKRTVRNGKGGKVVVPPPIKVTTICKVCGKEPYVVERIVAEKAWWCKNCFRCNTCKKLLTLDTYMSHEGVLYCKLHHGELFRPKAVVNKDDDIKNGSQEAVRRHMEQQRRMETIIRENKPVPSGAVNASTTEDCNDRYTARRVSDVDLEEKMARFKMLQAQKNGKKSSPPRTNRSKARAKSPDLMADYEEYGWSSGDEDKAPDEGKGEDDLECDPEIDAFLASVLAGADENERCMLTGEKRPSEAAQPDSGDIDREPRAGASDRYGIMEKLKRLQEGADLDDLLAEMDEELPSDKEGEEEEEEDEEDYGLTEVQKRSRHGPFGEQEKKDRLAEKRKRELAMMRTRVGTGHLPKDNKFDYLEDNVLNSSANKFKKTQVDVRSENASKFREMFDRGEAPEDEKTRMRSIVEKEAELELMRKGKRQQRDFFKKLESGGPEDEELGAKPEPKLLVGKLKSEKNGGGGDGGAGGSMEDDCGMAGMEMASLSSRYAFFENAKKKEEEEEKKKYMRRTPPKLRSHIFEDPLEGDQEELNPKAAGKGEVDHARRECKARSVLNKFKEMEQKVINGEEEVAERPRMKRFTPPRKGTGSQTESEYSDSDSDSYTGSSYTSSDYSDSESEDGDMDETLRAMKDAARAKALRAKFEEWENGQDAAEQARQMALHDENGESLQSAGLLRKRFEALQMMQQQEEQSPPPPPEPAGRRQRYQPRRLVE